MKYLTMALIGLFALFFAPASVWAQNPFEIPPPPGGTPPPAAQPTVKPETPPKGGRGTWTPPKKEEDKPDLCWYGEPPDPTTGQCKSLDEVLAERDEKKAEEVHSETNTKLMMGFGVMGLLCLILTFLVYRRSESRNATHIRRSEKKDGEHFMFILNNTKRIAALERGEDPPPETLEAPPKADGDEAA